MTSFLDSVEQMETFFQLPTWDNYYLPRDSRFLFFDCKGHNYTLCMYIEQTTHLNCGRKADFLLNIMDEKNPTGYEPMDSSTRKIQ